MIRAAKTLTDWEQTGAVNILNDPTIPTSTRVNPTKWGKHNTCKREWSPANIEKQPNKNYIRGKPTDR